MAFSVVLLLFVLWKCPDFVVSLNEEGVALLSFKGSLAEFSGGSFGSWNSSHETPCSWVGVTCKEERVVSLVIPERKLSGPLGDDLGALSGLRHLNLRDNRLSGALLPGFFRAKALKSLILSGNSLTGPVPPEIGRLDRLLALDLSRNSLNGSIPAAIARCKRVKAVLLNENLFSGPLPDGLSTGLRAVQILNLSSNRLEGSIPGELGNLSSLRATLDLSRNLFTGPIPASLGNLPETVYVDLSYNNLTGPIPQVDTLQDAGPTAFLGNPFLCGPPLSNPCSSATTNDMNSQTLIANPERDSAKREKLRHLAAVITIVAGVSAGTFFVAFLFTYSYKRIKANKRIGGCNFEEASIIRKDMFCFAKDVLETLSESLEQYNFVRLDPKIDFNIDQLLTASAFFLGKSGLGIVYRVVLENGLSFAVRRLGEGGGSQRFKEFQSEVEAIGKIKHPNILALRAYCWSVEEKLLIHDYVANGDLATAIHGKPGMVPLTPLSWPVRLRIMKGIARGLTHLHENSPKKYVHGSLKTSNILLGQNMEPQISDLGLCRLANISGESPSFHSEHSETPPQTLPQELNTTTSSPATAIGLCYRAPEASNLRKPSQKWDVYSFGVIVLEMISGKFPLVQVGAGEMDIVQWFHFSIGNSEPLVQVLDPFLLRDLDMKDEILSAVRIALACVHRSPEKRPSIKYVYDSLARLA